MQNKIQNKMNILDTLFLPGRTYYNRLKNKPISQQAWYEYIYILYYENFKIIILIMICFKLLNFITVYHYNNTRRQSGGFNFVKGVSGVSGKITSSTMLSKSRKNMDKTKSALSAPFKKESYQKLGSSIKSGVQSGYTRGKELGSAGISYGADQIRENSEFIYKYIAMIFIGIGFSVYIFPVLAMFLIGALTFLIVRKSIAGVITM